LKVNLTGILLTILKELQAAVTGTSAKEKWSWLVMSAAMNNLAKSPSAIQPASI